MEQITYEWIRSRRKTIAIQIKEGGKVVVRTPYSISRKQVEDFLREKQDWIVKNQKQLHKAQENRMVITEEIRREGVERALRVLPERTDHYARLMGISYGRITIREQKTRWGSCSSKGNLNFNWKLVLMPMDLLDYVEKPEQVSRYLSMIRNRAEFLRQQTENLFGYSVVKSVPEGEASPLSLNRMLEECLASYYGALTGAGITPEISLPEQTVTRHLNRSSLTRIFDNIIGNALKYSGGDLSVVMDGAGTIVFSNEAKALDPVTAGRLFDRYYTVEYGQRGSGLGLSIARLLTERMGGEISADYREGRLFITLRFPDE